MHFLFIFSAFFASFLLIFLHFFLFLHFFGTFLHFLYTFCTLFILIFSLFFTLFPSSPLLLPLTLFSAGLTDNYDLLFAKDRHGQTHLQRAAAIGDVIRVTSLIEQGAEVNVVDHAGWTPLHEAALEGHMEVVKCLVEVLIGE